MGFGPQRRGSYLEIVAAGPIKPEEPIGVDRQSLPQPSRGIAEVRQHGRGEAGFATEHPTQQSGPARSQPELGEKIHPGPRLTLLLHLGLHTLEQHGPTATVAETPVEKRVGIPIGSRHPLVLAAPEVVGNRDPNPRVRVGSVGPLPLAEHGKQDCDGDIVEAHPVPSLGCLELEDFFS